MAIVNYEAYRNNQFVGKATMEGAETTQDFVVFPNATADAPGGELAISSGIVDASGAPVAVTTTVYDADTGTITVTFGAATAGDIVTVFATPID